MFGVQIFVSRTWFGIPPVLFLKNRQTGLAHRTSRASGVELDVQLGSLNIATPVFRPTCALARRACVVLL